MRILASALASTFLAISCLWADTKTLTTWKEPLRGMPLLYTFDVPPTRHNGEVWAFADANAGQIWVGSDELYLFNGSALHKVTLPFETYAVRALAHDATGKLWVGALNEIGFIEQSPIGRWYYVSARKNLKNAGIEKFGAVWSAHETAEGVVFIADQQVIRWNGSRFEHWDLPAKPKIFATQDNNELWISQPGTGLLRMTPAGPQLVVPAAELPDSPVIWTIAPTSNFKEQLFVCCLSGIYLGKEGKWSKLPNLSHAIDGKNPWHAVMLDDETIAIGTMQGLLIGTTNDEVLATIDRSCGLPNDLITGLSLHRDKGLLWVGCQGAMACIEIRGVTSVFDDRNGLYVLPVQKVITHQEQTYVLSRRALFCLKPKTQDQPATANPFTRLTAPLTDVMSSGQDLWLSDVSDIWRIVDGRATLEASGERNIFALASIPTSTDTLLFAAGSRIRTLTPTPSGKGQPRQNVNGDIGANFMSMALNGPEDLWVSNVIGGIFHFYLQKTSDLQFVRRYNINQQILPNINRPILTTLGRTVYVLSDRTILAYNTTRDSFESAPGMESFVALAGTSTQNPNEGYWIVRNKANAAETEQSALIRLRTDQNTNQLVWEPLEAPGLERAGPIKGLYFTNDGNDTLWVAGSHALIRFSINALATPRQPPAVTARSITVNDVPIEIPKSGDPLRLSAKTKRLQISLDGVTRFDGDKALVQAMLHGLSDDWSLPKSEPAFDFTGLRAGEYSFIAHTVDRFGRVGPNFKLPLLIAHPWYAGAPMIVVYSLACVLIVFASIRLRVHRLKRLNKRLNQLVEERTAELTRANAARNAFLEGLSHEVRNPLNGIINLVDLLRDTKLSPEAQHLAQALVRSAAHMKQVFGDVLSYTKLEYGYIKVNAEPFSLKLLLEDIVALFSAQAQEQKVELRVVFPPGPETGFVGDIEKIRSVINNFVNNALKYAPNHPVDLIVEYSQIDIGTNIDEVYIGVRDYGDGLSVDEQQNLFQKFYRGELAKKSGISGTGLGLAICRNLGEILGGSVGVTSELGKGATFWLKIPLKRTALPDKVDENNEPQKITPSVFKRALIVDDQEYNQVVLRGISRRLGYEPNVASQSDEVWPLVEQSEFDVIFLDWELPGMNGGEIAKRLRNHVNTQNAVIVATTAHDMDDIRQHCLESGMDGFAPKPFDTPKIKRILEDAYTQRAGRMSFSPPTTASDLAAPTPPSQLTLTAFSDFAAGDPERAQQAVSLYLETLDQELIQLNLAMGEQDREAVARRAHRLRSHAGLVNGIALNMAAQKLMLAARGQSAEDWQSCFRNVADEAAALKLAIKALCAESL